MKPKPAIKECSNCKLWNQPCSDAGKTCDRWLLFEEEPIEKPEEELKENMQ